MQAGGGEADESCRSSMDVTVSRSTSALRSLPPSTKKRCLLDLLATLKGEHPPERGMFDKVKEFFT
jgi:hypothetical protein